MRLPASSVTRVLPTPPVPVIVTIGLSSQHRSQALELGVAADQCRQLSRQIGRARLRRPHRRKVLREPGDLDLIDVDGLRRIVERRRTDVTQCVSALALGGDELGRGRGDQHLAAVSESQQPRGAVERRAEQITVAAFRRSHVHRHAHLESADRGKVVRRYRALCVEGRADRIRRSPEHRVERIAGGLENLAAVRGNGLAQHRVVLAHRFLHRTPKVEPAQARTFDVGEEQRDQVGTLVRSATSPLPKRYDQRACSHSPASSCGASLASGAGPRQRRTAHARGGRHATRRAPSAVHRARIGHARSRCAASHRDQAPPDLAHPGGRVRRRRSFKLPYECLRVYRRRPRCAVTGAGRKCCRSASAT